ncbi:hypothetical protein FA13DRAFT_1748262 [Coprinellus micaceus]|uniref:HMG box domain-containing protein n=1 Tax=Coprinellus micaceus TaxID=71717 RepID=A0A4Y7RXW9_COPMI|nr:hypothetical protein FA13DRAFT_1748262 [Coprinellus micaceus]
MRLFCLGGRRVRSVARRAPAKKQRQADLSKAISEKWRSLSGEEKRVWEERAKVRFCALSRPTLKSSLRNGMGT